MHSKRRSSSCSTSPTIAARRRKLPRPHGYMNFQTPSQLRPRHLSEDALVAETFQRPYEDQDQR
jgi:hypothetical protein